MILDGEVGWKGAWGGGKRLGLSSINTISRDSLEVLPRDQGHNGQVVSVNECRSFMLYY